MKKNTKANALDFTKRRRMGPYVIVGRDETPKKGHELPYVDPYLFECGYYDDVEDYAESVRTEVGRPIEFIEVD